MTRPDDDADLGGMATAVATPVDAATARLPPDAAPTAAATGALTRYQVQGPLGHGGMGEVVLAFDEHVGRDVAIKRMRVGHTDEELRGRFVREARIQGRLEHPTIVPVHDIGVDGDGQPYFVMKRVAGKTLASLIAAVPDETTDRDGAHRARTRLLRAFVDVCLAIEFAHQRAIIHRDLKPLNVMLGDFGEVYVLDWGLARSVGSHEPAPTPLPHPKTSPGASLAPLSIDSDETRAGTVLGTPGYMAPEQFDGDRVGPAADVYALGCILFEIVAGEPLHARSRLPIDVDARPSTRRPSAGPEFDDLCVRATAEDAAARLPSARALADAVQLYLDGDRDLALRQQLASGHVATARAALGTTTEAARAQAMREAGRALALDPTSTAAAAIVTDLMLRPPAEVPAEVVARLEANDVASGRLQGRYAVLSLLGYLLFLPLLWWSGMREAGYVVALAALALANAGVVWRMTHQDHVPLTEIYLSAVLNACIIAVVTRMVGPFIVAPTLTATTLIAYASHPRFGRLDIVGALLAAGVLVPWGLELAGVVAPTYHFVDGAIVLSSHALAFTSAPVQVTLLALLVVLLVVVAVLARRVANAQRAATLQVEVQAWQIRQLMPRAPE